MSNACIKTFAIGRIQRYLKSPDFGRMVNKLPREVKEDGGRPSSPGNGIVNLNGAKKTLKTSPPPFPLPSEGEGVKNSKYAPSPYPLPRGERVNEWK
jgi:hypothetical protein